MNSPEREVEKKAADGSLEVENLLDLALVGDAATADFLRLLRVSGKLGASDRSLRNSVPFHDWSRVVEHYLSGGFLSLAVLAKGKYANFVIGLLEHLHSQESIAALLSMFSHVLDEPDKNSDLADKLVSAVNSVMSFPPKVSVKSELENRLRVFIHRYIDLVDDDHRYATAICALRGCGNISSIDLIKSKKKLHGDWQGVESSVIKVIQSRLKNR